MKYYFLLLLLIPFKSVSQNLDYNDLVNILSMSIIESNEYIENKGYRIFENGSTTKNTLSYIWDKQGNNKSISYLLITLDKSKNYKMVWYQFHSQQHFNILKNHLDKVKYKLVDSYIEFESIYYDYKSPMYSVTLSKGENSYIFSIKNNK